MNGYPIVCLYRLDIWSWIIFSPLNKCFINFHSYFLIHEKVLDMYSIRKIILSIMLGKLIPSALCLLFNQQN